MTSVALGVNIDHVATLRNVRGTFYPDILQVADLAINSGADFITVHLREDRRHIKDDDVKKLKNHIKAPLNLEIAATDEMLKISENIKPSSVCLVPEKRHELTTEGGLEVEKSYDYLVYFINRLHSLNIKVTLFVEPETQYINYAKALNADTVELHTGLYCNSNHCSNELEKIKQAAILCKQYNIICHAGHGLNYKSASIIAKLPNISALNIGHFLISESILHGISYAVTTIKKIINDS